MGFPCRVPFTNEVLNILESLDMLNKQEATPANVATFHDHLMVVLHQEKLRIPRGAKTGNGDLNGGHVYMPHTEVD
jgi:hypothetical protein